jgi:hypothetical protein
VIFFFSEQISAPMYIFLVSNLAGDLCSASMIAKRLESHGARSMTQHTDYDDFSPEEGLQMNLNRSSYFTCV